MAVPISTDYITFKFVSTHSAPDVVSQLQVVKLIAQSVVARLPPKTLAEKVYEPIPAFWKLFYVLENERQHTNERLGW